MLDLGIFGAVIWNSPDTIEGVYFVCFLLPPPNSFGLLILPKSNELPTNVGIVIFGGVEAVEMSGMSGVVAWWFWLVQQLLLSLLPWSSLRLLVISVVLVRSAVLVISIVLERSDVRGDVCGSYMSDVLVKLMSLLS